MRRGVLRADLIGCILVLGAASPAFAQAPAPLILHKSDDLTVTGHFQGGVNLVAEHNLFWRFAETVAGVTDFDPNAEWLEAYLKPAVTFERRISDQATLYGGLSGVYSMTVGADAFNAGDTGRATLEEGYLGWRYKGAVTGFDMSVGSRDFKAGTAMLIAADQLRSPVQFGQATRVEVQNGVNSPNTGVTRRHLSDDLYVEYFRVVSPNLFLTTGFSVSVPGAGIKSIVDDAPVWTGAYVNLIANY